MRRDKAVTRILLILSVVHAAVSAPAIIRQRSLEPEVTKGVTPASLKRSNSDDESSHAFPQMDNTLPTTSGTVPSHDDTPPAPSDPQLHSDPSPELGTPQLNIEQPPTSGTPQLHDSLPPTPGAPPSQEDPLPASGTPQLHNGEPPTPGAPALASQGDMSSVSEGPQVHYNPSPWQQHNILRPPGEMLQGESSVVPQSDDSDDPWCPVHHPDCQWRPSPWQQHTNLHPPGEMLQGESSVFPQLDDDPWSDVHHTDWRSPWEVLRGEVPAPSIQVPSRQLSDILIGSLDEKVRLYYAVEPPEWWETLEAPELQNDPPAASGSPQVHDNPPPAPGSPQPSYHSDDWEAFSIWSSNSEGPSSPQTPELQNDPPAAPGSPQVHDDPPPAPGSPHPSYHSDEWPYYPPSWYYDSEGPLSSHSESEAPMPVDLEVMPVDSEAPSSSHSDSEVPMPVDSEAPSSSHFASEALMPVDSEAPLLHSETPQPLESEAPPSAPETHTIFNDALKQKLKVSAGVGAVAGVFVGLAFGVDKLIKDHSHKSQPAGRGLSSGSVVIRGESMYLSPKRPISRANVNLRYDDLRLLSILTRRALERLD